MLSECLVTDCLGHACLSDSILCWASTLTDAVLGSLTYLTGLGRPGSSLITGDPASRNAFCLPAPLLPKALLSNSCLAPASWKAGLGGASGKDQQEEKAKIISHPPDLPNWGLLAVVKAWQCGLWRWCVASVTRKDLRKRREGLPASSLKTLALIAFP